MLILTEMAFNKKKALSNLSATNSKRYEHLMKVFFYRDTRKDNYKHWCEEITEFCQVDECRARISAKEYNRVVWDEPKDNYNERRMRIKLQNNAYRGFPEILNYSYTNFWCYLREFHLWLVAKLVVDKEVLEIEVDEVLQKLLNKYSKYNKYS